MSTRERHDVACGDGVDDSRLVSRSAALLLRDHRHRAVGMMQHRLSCHADLRSEMPVAPMAPDGQEVGSCETGEQEPAYGTLDDHAVHGGPQLLKAGGGEVRGPDGEALAGEAEGIAAVAGTELHDVESSFQWAGQAHGQLLSAESICS
jgi:hypothetical protein